jgi:hypothetical protein
MRFADGRLQLTLPVNLAWFGLRKIIEMGRRRAEPVPSSLREEAEC